MDNEVQVKDGGTDVLIATVDVALEFSGDGIVTPVCICCGGPSDVTTGH